MTLIAHHPTSDHGGGAAALYVGSGGRRPAARDPAPARPGAQAADAAQQGRAAVRRRPLGPPRPPGARRLRGRARDRGVEVLYLERLLADVLGPAAVRDAHVLDRTLDAVDLGPTSGPSRSPSGSPRSPAAELGRPADRRHHLRRAAVPPGHAPRPSRRSTASSCRRCPTTCSRATRRPGSTTASRSTRWRWRHAGASRSTTTRSTATTPCSPSAATPLVRRTRRPCDSRAETCSSSATAACSSAWASARGPSGVERLARRLFKGGSVRW